MPKPVTLSTAAQPPSLETFAVGALALRAPDLPDAPELDYLHAQLERCGGDARAWERNWIEYLAKTNNGGCDARLLQLRAALGLTPIELLATALALAVERDPMTGRALAFLQRPVAGSRPSLWLVDAAFSFLAPRAGQAVDALLAGAALGSGLIALHGLDLPLIERTLLVPSHVLSALRGLPAARAGYELHDPVRDALALPPSFQQAAVRYAEGLVLAPARALVIRSGTLREARAAAAAVAESLGQRALFITSEDISALSPWLHASGLVPVFQRKLGPAERFQIPSIAHYAGPLLIVSGLEGGIDGSCAEALTWRIDVPPPAERQVLWQRALGDEAVSVQLAQAHRHGVARIAALGQLAQQHAHAAGRALTLSDVATIACSSDAAGLGALAEPMRERIPADALVTSPQLQRELELVLLRCRAREGLVQGLGVSATTRYRPGVRALFAGPSGTGKTLAAGWIATQLGLPLYRVDVASIVSKYIGETESNLAELLAKAESAEVLLLFDEADSLFGARTEVKQANDRFANMQTNYLLQRIESYDGIVVLTTNNRARLDAAFSRRLDFVVEFSSPKPDERRRLWLAHLGEHHNLAPRQINQLAAQVDLSGGHIRNVVLCGAVLAQQAQRPIAWEDVMRGLAIEYRKLGKQVPGGLADIKVSERPV